MLRKRLFFILAGYLLATCAAWADDVGFVDCHDHSENIQVLGKAAKTSQVVASLPCGERFTILLYGVVFSRIQTKDDKIGYIHSYLISRDYSATSVQPSAAKTSAQTQPATARVAPSQAVQSQPVPADSRAEPNATPLTNKNVVDMLKMQLAPEIVVAKIKSSACNFDTSPAALQELKTAGVPDNVILAMVQAPVASKIAGPVPDLPSPAVNEQQNRQQTAPQQSNSQPATPQPSPAASVSTKVVPGSKVYIENMGGFESYLAAAFTKKKVQLVLVADKDQADYVVSGNSEDKKAGWAKIIFMGNIHSDATASVTMTDKKTSGIVFAYAVNKKNTMHGQQTAAEACAKHLQAHIEGRE